MRKMECYKNNREICSSRNNNRLSNRMRMSSKKCQTGNGAATLIAVITLFIVFYILFVPPDVRDLLLNSDDSSDDDGVTQSNKLISYLVDKQPGMLQYSSLDENEHPIPYFKLKETKYSNYLAEENPFTLKKSWFSTKEKSISFPIASIKDTEKVLLSFNVENPVGTLEVEINGITIFEKEMTTGIMDPIEIPVKHLKENNIIKMSVSQPNAFWKSNSFGITNLKVAGNFVDDTSLDNSHKFFLETGEYNNIEKSWLVFSPLCKEYDVGKLTIRLNGQSIYSGLPDCSNKNSITFSPDLFEENSNLITFSSAKGDYAIDLAYVRTRISEIEYPKYYFEISDSTYDKIEANDQYINITIDMLDNNEFKEGYVLLNSAKLGYIDTNDNEFVKKITKEHVIKGTNVVTIEPLNSFEVVRMRVGLYD